MASGQDAGDARDRGRALGLHGHGVGHRWATDRARVPARRRPTLRGTLARFFTIGNLISIPTLIVAGRLGRAELPAIAVLVPGALAGYTVSGWLAVHLDKRTARPIILGLSAAAAGAVLIRALA